VVLIIGRRWMHASTQRQPAQHPVHPPDRGGRTLIPVERSVTFRRSLTRSGDNPFPLRPRRKALARRFGNTRRSGVSAVDCRSGRSEPDRGSLGRNRRHAADEAVRRLRWHLAAYSLARPVVGWMGSGLEVHAERMNSSPHQREYRGLECPRGYSATPQGRDAGVCPPQGRARGPTRGAVRGLPDAELRCEGRVWVELSRSGASTGGSAIGA
jgi:hypothetical protein